MYPEEDEEALEFRLEPVSASRLRMCMPYLLSGVILAGLAVEGYSHLPVRTAARTISTTANNTILNSETARPNLKPQSQESASNAGSTVGIGRSTLTAASSLKIGEWENIVEVPFRQRNYNFGMWNQRDKLTLMENSDSVRFKFELDIKNFNPNVGHLSDVIGFDIDENGFEGYGKRVNNQPDFQLLMYNGILRDFYYTGWNITRYGYKNPNYNTYDGYGNISVVNLSNNICLIDLVLPKRELSLSGNSFKIADFNRPDTALIYRYVHPIAPITALEFNAKFHTNPIEKDSNLGGVSILRKCAQ